MEQSYIIDNGIEYICKLNQTDIKTNKNKFYTMCLQNDNGNFKVVCTYGRVGEKGKSDIHPYSSKESAIGYFEDQFHTKTGNYWSKVHNNHDSFVQKKGKYYLIINKKEETKEEKKVDIVNSELNLDKRIIYFLELITDKSMINNVMTSVGINTEKMPLGSLSDVLISKAKVILENIKQGISKKAYDALVDLSSDFYTVIPCAFSRNTRPEIINTDELYDKYCKLIEELSDIAAMTTVIKKSDGGYIENIYKDMNTEIKPLDKESKMFSVINQYVKNSHGSTHRYNMSVIDILEIKRKNQVESMIPNKTLLFHGSRLTNWFSILKLGLLLDPSKLGVTITGKMFGYGIYFANSVSKSAQYTGLEYTNNVCCMLLCEVALGKPLEHYSHDYSLSLDSVNKLKCNSTQGMGRNRPDESIIIDNVTIPYGKLTKAKDSSNCCLEYDEFIVYDVGQINIKYLVIMKNN